MTTRSIHTRAALDDGLAQLQADLRAMTSLLDVAIERSVLSLQTLDQRLAKLVIDSDEQINRMRFQIEDRAIHLIATQQPIAGDLRFIVAVLMVVSEIERMGDYAAGIAKVVQLHENRQLLKPLVDIPEMARLVREMLREAVDAFLRRNEHTAERVAFQDDEVDRLYDIVYRELLQYMANDPTTIDRATWLLWVAHNLERMGDRIQNICERTVYEVTGVMREFSLTAPAHALDQTGYGHYSEVIFTGGAPVSVSYEVFVNVRYAYVNPSQIEILAGFSTLRGCLKNAQSLYEQTGYVSSWTRGWYIWSDASGDIDSDPLAGDTNGMWPACSGGLDWGVYAVTSSNHWPPAGTRVKGRTAYCVLRELEDGGLQGGCSAYRVTFSGYMW